MRFFRAIGEGLRSAAVKILYAVVLTVPVILFLLIEAVASIVRFFGRIFRGVCGKRKPKRSETEQAVLTKKG
ncbi:MAG: hypothetical protein K2H43_03545 [Clostridia bacterium]|nr:hypothetical protein [Clostridia bacterium]